MRKLLLATVAALGVSTGVASYADAQIVMDDSTDGQSFPTPGQVTVRLNGRYRFYAGILNEGSARTSNFPGTNANPTVGTTTVQAVNTANQGQNRLSNYEFENYVRLYPGFDGVAANGLKYGASAEIRQDNVFGAGGGVYGSTTGQTRTRGSLYFRRSFGYIGTDRFGTVRVGSGDQPSSLYLTGTYENFNDGGLDGDTPGLFPSGSVAGINWAWNDVGNMYTTTKVVYLSPQFYGLDFGLSYEPSTAGIGNDNGAGCDPNPQFGSTTLSGAQAVATPGCDALASTSTADYARRRNTYEALVRYRGTFGPVGVAAEISYDGSGRVQDTGNHQKLEDLSYFDAGLTTTFAGFSVGGNYQRGRYSVLSGGGGGSLLNRGQPDSSALIVGATYTIGPIIVGAHALRENYEGDRQTATNRNQATGAITGLAAGQVGGGQRVDQGFAAGGTYSLAPGVSIYLAYAWAQSKQNGYNLLAGTSNNPNNNKLIQSVVALGTSFAW